MTNNELPQCAKLTVIELAQSLQSRLSVGPPIDEQHREIWQRVTHNHAWSLAQAVLEAAMREAKKNATELLSEPPSLAKKAGPK